MFPQTYQSSAAGVLLLGGLLACFAGYRLFRFVLAVYGFILGALLASSVMAASDTSGMIVSAIVGGVIGALVMFAAYFVGVALVGAGLGALAVHVISTQIGGGDPHPLIVVAFSVAGAIGAMWLQRYVIVAGTAIGGAWTVIVGALALIGDSAARSSEVWIVYPLDPSPHRAWVIVAWILLSLFGLVLQLGVTGPAKRGR